MILPATAAEITISTGTSINSTIASATPGDVIILNQGIYPENGIVVGKSITLRANTLAGGSPLNTVIDGGNLAPRILTVNPGVSLAIDNLTLQNGQSTGIENSDGGGAILNNGPSLTITSSALTGCSADLGGAIFSWSTSSLAITSTTITACSASTGSAVVVMEPPPVVPGAAGFAGISENSVSDRADNDAAGITTIQFSRIYQNTGVALFNVGGTVTATNNWWGTNSDPSAKVSGIVSVSPWLVLNITAMPSSITTSQTSTIRANLTRNSAGSDTAITGIFVPAGIPVSFTRSSGSGTILPVTGTVMAGANTTRFTPAGQGISTVTATIDGETVAADIIVTTGGAVGDRIGVFRPSTHLFYEDYNGNGVWNGAVTDRSRNFGITGDLPITGDWNNDGVTDIGVFRPSTHHFYLDYNGNGIWNGAVTDRLRNFGITGDIPITGDWNNDGTTDIGVFRPSTHLFYLDYNGNGVWNGAVTDRSRNFGITGDIPITGDWNNDGTTDIGVFRPSTHLFYLDYNGNGVWNGAVTDRSRNFGITGDIPVTGDWNNDGTTDIGVFRPSTHLFYLDYNGNGVWNGAVTDRNYNFGINGDVPLAGKWN
jgi:hypothetical protein